MFMAAEAFSTAHENDRFLLFIYNLRREGLFRKRIILEDRSRDKSVRMMENSVDLVESRDCSRMRAVRCPAIVLATAIDSNEEGDSSDL